MVGDACIFIDLLLEEMGKERKAITQEVKSIQGAKESTHMTNAVNLQYNYVGKGEMFRSDNRRTEGTENELSGESHFGHRLSYKHYAWKQRKRMLA